MSLRVCQRRVLEGFPFERITINHASMTQGQYIRAFVQHHGFNFTAEWADRHIDHTILRDNTVRRLHDHWIGSVANAGLVIEREVLRANNVVA